jgi:hypothetical protein
MTPRCALALTALVASLAGAHAQTSERVRSAVACKPVAGDALAYDCTIELKGAKSAKAIAGAEIVVGADMPSMPMAHNVKPVAATAAATPGTYTARLALEMHGDWAVHVTINAPSRDKTVQVLTFKPNAVAEPARAARPAAPGTKHNH